MKVDFDLLSKARADLGLDIPFVKGKNISVHNCWHFSTDGNSVDRIFEDERDFQDGMNRIFITAREFKIIILAFCLMDTHVHFILYGDFYECNRFVHKYIQQLSRNISIRHKDAKRLSTVKIHHQTIDTDFYLKVAICYVLKNPPVASLPYNSYDYSWSSAPLYFRSAGTWNSPRWLSDSNLSYLNDITIANRRELLRTKDVDFGNVRIIDNIIFPGEYVAYRLVEEVFRTHKSFSYFMGISKESDVESRGGSISRLSIPMQEMRMYRDEICKNEFKVTSIRMLDTKQRLRLAKVLRSRYNSSIKQISRLCGLLYEETKNLI